MHGLFNVQALKTSHMLHTNTMMGTLQPQYNFTIIFNILTLKPSVPLTSHGIHQHQ